jgi:hypothetical protein
MGQIATVVTFVFEYPLVLIRIGGDVVRGAFKFDPRFLHHDQPISSLWSHKVNIEVSLPGSLLLPAQTIGIVE